MSEIDTIYVVDQNKITEYILISRHSNHDIYDNPQKVGHRIFVVDNYIQDTMYYLSSDQLKEVNDTTWERSNEYDCDFDDLYQDILIELYGKIQLGVVYYNLSEATNAVLNYNIQLLTKRLESNKRTLTMYFEDNEKTQTSYNKVEKCEEVENINIGTILYKYINNTYGVFKYQVIGYYHDDFLDQDFYEVECLNCRHSGDKCILWVAKTLGTDKYAFIKMNDSTHEHRHYHASLDQMFHSSSKTAYTKYLNNIIDYNREVINKFKAENADIETHIENYRSLLSE